MTRRISQREATRTYDTGGIPLPPPPVSPPPRLRNGSPGDSGPVRAAGAGLVRERPILFSGAMVRAILSVAKTQTRRVIKPQPPEDWTPIVGPYHPTITVRGEFAPGPDVFGASDEDHGAVCPYGKPGDRLWVRETWAVQSEYEFLSPSEMPADAKALYHADKDDWIKHHRWRPSIHMPRWASRITLEVTDVRVQRVQEISEEDAKAEGLRGVTKDGSLVKWGIPDRDGLPGNDDYGWHWRDFEVDPRAAYAKLWDSINAKRGYEWSVNPWVWAISFRVIPGERRRIIEFPRMAVGGGS